MSSCNNDLYDFEIIKKCYKYGILLLKSNFHEEKPKNYGFHSQCRFCRKKYYVDNKNRLLNKQNL